MNFNFKQPKFSFAPPIARHYSTMGLSITKPERNDFGSKAENLFIQSNFLNNLSPSVLQNKSFSNPNFVNKQNPNVFTSYVASPCDNAIVAHPIYENVKNSCLTQPPRHANHSEIPKESRPPVYQPIPDQVSSQPKPQMPVHSVETVTNNHLHGVEKSPPHSATVSPKAARKSTRHRRHRRGKRSKQEPLPSESSASQRSRMTQKKPPKTLCSLPKRMKKDAEFARHRGRRGRKAKPWHKISMDMEIMECDEAASPQSPNCPGLEAPHRPTICIEWQSSPIEIVPKFNGTGRGEAALSMAMSPCTAEFLKTLGTSNLSASEYSSSPASPALRRLRMPSECDSEDSFVVFCDDVSACTSDTEALWSEDDDDDDATDEAGSESDLDVVHFCETISLNTETARKKKKVCFKVDSELCDVHPMIHWNFAYQKARIGPWEQFARDRARFESRISKTEAILSCILQPDHRERIYRERFDNPD